MVGGSNMFIKCISVGKLETNCYILCDTVQGKAAVIDPGYDAKRILIGLSEVKCKAEYVILTHGHFDHICAVLPVLEKTGAKLVCYKKEMELLNDPNKNLSALYLPVPLLPLKPDLLLCDGDSIQLGMLELKVLHTPGHTPGSCCIICQDTIFTGDTLFCSGAGRTDFPGGDYNALRASMKRLKALKGDYQLLPGHGAFSTLSQERQTNSLMNSDDLFE